MAKALSTMLAHPQTAFAMLRALPTSATAFSIGDSFRIWSIDGAALLDSPLECDLADLATPTARIHHQVRVEDTFPGYARSDETTKGFTLKAYTVSDIARRIDRAMASLAPRLRTKPGVRLLSIPAERTKCLWIVPRRAPRASHVYVVAAPKGSGVVPGRLLPSRDFLTKLRRAHQRTHRDTIHNFLEPK